MGRKSMIPEIESRIGRPLKEYLLELIKSGKQVDEIASEISLSRSSTYSLILKLKLKSQLKEAQRLASIGINEGELVDFIEEYVNWKERQGLTPATIRNTKQFFKSWLWWLNFARIPLDIVHALSQENVGGFLDYCRSVTPRFGGTNDSARRPMGERTYNNIWVNLFAFIHWIRDVKEAIDERQVTRMKRAIPKMKERVKTMEDLPDEILVKIVDSFDETFEGVRGKAIMTFFIETGMRIDGVTNLKRNQFNLETGWGVVTEKGQKERDIHLSGALLEQLKKYIEIRDNVSSSDSLWVKDDGFPYTRRAIEKMVAAFNVTLADDMKRLCPDEKIHPHIFRHIWTKFLVEANVGIQAVADMGGWNDLKLVQHYARAHSKKLAWNEYEKASPLNKIRGGGS